MPIRNTGSSTLAKRRRNSLRSTQRKAAGTTRLPVDLIHRLGPALQQVIAGTSLGATPADLHPEGVVRTCLPALAITPALIVIVFNEIDMATFTATPMEPATITGGQELPPASVSGSAGITPCNTVTSFD